MYDSRGQPGPAAIGIIADREGLGEEAKRSVWMGNAAFITIVRKMPHMGRSHTSAHKYTLRSRK